MPIFIERYSDPLSRVEASGFVRIRNQVMQDFDRPRCRSFPTERTNDFPCLAALPLGRVLEVPDSRGSKRKDFQLMDLIVGAAWSILDQHCPDSRGGLP